MANREEANRELARRAWDAVSHGDVAALVALTASNLVWHATGRSSWSGDYFGRDTVFDFLSGLGGDAEVFDSTLHHVLVGDDRAALLLHISGRRKEKSLDTDLDVILRIEADHIVEIWSVPHDQHAFAQFWE